MRLPTVLAAVLLTLALASAAIPPPAAGADTTPTLGYLVYLPAVVTEPSPTATPTATPTFTATPTPTATPSATPAPPLEWDPRLTFLNIQLTRATGSPRWTVTKGVFQDWNEGGGSAAVYIDVLDQYGQRLNLTEGTTIGVVRNGGDIDLVWGAKPANEYPVNSGMYKGLGSYTIWLTLDGLDSDRVAGMGLVQTTGDPPVLTDLPGGKVHCNYLFTFRRVGP
jgi:hypothetical protein